MPRLRYGTAINKGTSANTPSSAARSDRSHCGSVTTGVRIAAAPATSKSPPSSRPPPRKSGDCSAEANSGPARQARHTVAGGQAHGGSRCRPSGRSQAERNARHRRGQPERQVEEPVHPVVTATVPIKKASAAAAKPIMPSAGQHRLSCTARRLAGCPRYPARRRAPTTRTPRRGRRLSRQSTR